MRIQLDLDKEGAELIDDLKALTGLKRHQDFFNSAITLFNWVVLQRLLGRSIVSVSDRDNVCKELVMPPVERVLLLDDRARQAAIMRRQGSDDSDLNSPLASRAAAAG